MDNQKDKTAGKVVYWKFKSRLLKEIIDIKFNGSYAEAQKRVTRFFPQKKELLSPTISSIKGWAEGKVDPSASNMIALSKALAIPLDDFVEDYEVKLIEK